MSTSPISFPGAVGDSIFVVGGYVGIAVVGAAVLVEGKAVQKKR